MEHFFHQFAYYLFDPEGLKALITAFGIPLLFLIIFAETGLLVGFFLPGDSLLFVAGFTTAVTGGPSELLWLNISLIAAAIIGDSVGYWFGKRAGRSLYRRKDGLIFRRKHIALTRAFYRKHGGKTIIIARFVPIVRTFAPIIAGVASMSYRRFMSYNIFGGIFWVSSLTILGYKLGRVQWVAENLEKAILIVIALSVMPLVIEGFRSWRSPRRRRVPRRLAEARAD